MSTSIVPNNPSIIKIPKAHFDTQPNRVSLGWPVTTKCRGSVICDVPKLVARANQQPIPDIPLQPDQGNQDDKRIVSKESNGGAPIPNILSMAKWIFGSFIMVVPFYHNFLRLEATIESNVTSVLHVVEKVVQTIDEVVEDVKNSLPENSNLKKIAQRVDKFVEEVGKDAKVLESLVGKEMNSGDQNTKEKNMLGAPAMSFVRSFLSNYRRRIRYLSVSETHSRNLDVAPWYQGNHLLEQRSFSSAFQHDRTETSRNIGVPRANPGPTPPPSSGGPPIFTWMKIAIGSLFTLVLPFLYTQWKNILKIGGEIEAAKEAVEKTAEVVEKVAEITEKAAEEAAEQLNDGELKDAVEVVERISEKVEEDAHIVEDIIHKVDEIEEDIMTLIEPSKHDDAKNELHGKNKLQGDHDECKPEENLS